MTMSPSKTPSDPKFAAVNPDEPADVREARIVSNARVTILSQLISSLTDWLGIICLTYLIAMKALGPEFGWAIPALASGSTVAKMRKLQGGSTVGLLVAGGPVVWKTIAVVAGRHILALGIALSGVLALGCAGAALPTKPIADARKLVDATDKPIADIDHALIGVGSGLLAIEPVLLAVCTGTEPKADPEQCRRALKGYDIAQAGHDIAVEALVKGSEALVAVDAALATLEAVAEALK